jgi:glutamate 5-kinase
VSVVGGKFLRRTKLIEDARRVVVKIGSAVLLGNDRRLDAECLAGLCGDIAALAEGGRSVVVVSSGAIACGCERLGLTRRPDTLPALQAAAAVGQNILMDHYEKGLSSHGLHAGQMLLTRDDLADRRRYLNARNTLRALVAADCIPVINENDTIATDEIRFGENDVLSALVTNMFEADLLIMLSTVDGLHEDYDKRGADGPLVAEVEAVDAEISKLVSARKSATGAGGMSSKLEAAKIVAASGEAALIANGKRPRVLADIFAGEKVGTLFFPIRSRVAPKKRWIGYGARARGEVIVDEGAADALRRAGKSLLPAGVTAVKGDFAAGDVVSIRGKVGEPFARGVVQYSADEIDRIKGLRTSAIAATLGSKPYDEIVHRDHMTLL